MKSKNLPPLGKTLSVMIDAHLKATGLEIEFQKFFSDDDDFHTHEFVEMLFMLRGTYMHYTAPRPLLGIGSEQKKAAPRRAGCRSNEYYGSEVTL